MTEQDWTTSPIVKPQSEFRHEAVIDGLKVTINEGSLSTDWLVEGWLADAPVWSGDYHGHRRSLDVAKAQAIAAAHRLHAVGVRGAKSFPVACCERIFATADAADQHEGEHRAAEAEEGK
jgi:hypothetical protein